MHATCLALPLPYLLCRLARADTWSSKVGAVLMSAGFMQEQPDTDPEEDAAAEQEGTKLQTRRSTRAVKKVKTFAEEFISSETPTASPGSGDAFRRPHLCIDAPRETNISSAQTSCLS